jgi:hypothetical protein
MEPTVRVRKCLSTESSKCAASGDEKLRIIRDVSKLSATNAFHLLRQKSLLKMGQ